MVRRTVETLVVVAALLVAAAIGAGRWWPQPGTGLYWRAAAIAQMPQDTDITDFVGLRLRASPNQALVCPERLCQKAKSDMPAPIFPVSAAELRRKIGIVVAAEPNSDELGCGDDCAKAGRFVEYSPLFFFPDVIDVRVVEAGATSSTLAIYSRSVFGYWDFGVNQDRIARWLAALDRTIQKS